MLELRYQIRHRCLCQSLSPFSDTLLNYTDCKVKRCVHFLTFSLLMCHSPVVFLSVFWLQHRWPIVICLQSLTLKVSDVWFYSEMWLHKDFTFLLLFLFYSTAPVESQGNLFSGITLKQGMLLSVPAHPASLTQWKEEELDFILAHTSSAGPLMKFQHFHLHRHINRKLFNTAVAKNKSTVGTHSAALALTLFSSSLWRKD